MRKRYKRKRHSCKVCKPGKMGLSVRWSPREESRLKEFERQKTRGDWD